MTQILIRPSEAAALSLPSSEADEIGELWKSLVKYQVATVLKHRPTAEHARRPRPYLPGYLGTESYGSLKVQVQESSPNVQELRQLWPQVSDIGSGYSCGIHPELRNAYALAQPGSQQASGTILWDGEPLPALRVWETLEFLHSGVWGQGISHWLISKFQSSGDIPASSLSPERLTTSKLGNTTTDATWSVALRRIRLQEGEIATTKPTVGFGDLRVFNRTQTSSAVGASVTPSRRLRDLAPFCEAAHGIHTLDDPGVWFSTPLSPRRMDAPARTYHNSPEVRKYVRYARRLISAALAAKVPVLGAKVYLGNTGITGRCQDQILQVRVSFGPTFLSENPDAKYKATLLTSDRSGNWSWLMAGAPEDHGRSGWVEPAEMLKAHPVSVLWANELCSSLSDVAGRALYGPLGPNQAAIPLAQVLFGGTNTENAAAIAQTASAAGAALMIGVGVEPVHSDDFARSHDRLLATILVEEDVPKSALALAAEGLFSETYPATCRVAPTKPAKHGMGYSNISLVFGPNAYGWYKNMIQRFTSTEVRSSDSCMSIQALGGFFSDIATTLERSAYVAHWQKSVPVV